MKKTTIGIMIYECPCRLCGKDFLSVTYPSEAQCVYLPKCDSQEAREAIEKAKLSVSMILKSLNEFCVVIVKQEGKFLVDVIFSLSSKGRGIFSLRGSFADLDDLTIDSLVVIEDFIILKQILHNVVGEIKEFARQYIAEDLQCVVREMGSVFIDLDYDATLESGAIPIQHNHP